MRGDSKGENMKKKINLHERENLPCFIFVCPLSTTCDCSKHKPKEGLSPGASHINTAGNVRGRQGFIDDMETLWESVLVSKGN